MFYVYILYSKSIDKYYIGHTDDLVRRLAEHNSGKTRYTAQQGAPWELLYRESYPTRSEASKREREIKSKKKRTYIEQLINTNESKQLKLILYG